MATLTVDQDWMQIEAALRGFLVDHVRRGWSYARAHGHLQPGEKPIFGMLHELGATLLLQELQVAGTLRCLAPSRRHSPRFLELLVQIRARQLYDRRLSALETSILPWGWDVVCLRLRGELWPEQVGETSRFMTLHGNVMLNDAALDALAELLWATRHVSMN